MNKIQRIWHPWDKWECYKSGFFNKTNPKNMTNKEAENIYYNFLKDLDYFEKVLKKVILEWKYSCEHNLTNESMNRIAWLGQACLCYEFKIPSERRSGFNLLSENQQNNANALAEAYLYIWLNKHKEGLCQ